MFERCETMARTSKSIEDRVAVIDAAIAKKKEGIAQLEAKKHALLHPITMKEIMTKAKDSGLSLAEIAQRLGVEPD